MFDLTPLSDSIVQLEKSLLFATSPMAKGDHELFVQFRAATIKGFEFTYEVSIKVIKRYIEMTKPDVNVDRSTFMNLMREAWEYGLIRDVPSWSQYREKRNITSHTYHEDAAAEVFAIVPGFLADALFLRDQIKQRQEPGT